MRAKRRQGLLSIPLAAGLVAGALVCQGCAGPRQEAPPPAAAPPPPADSPPPAGVPPSDRFDAINCQRVTLAEQGPGVEARIGIGVDVVGIVRADPGGVTYEQHPVMFHPKEPPTALSPADRASLARSLARCAEKQKPADALWLRLLGYVRSYPVAG